MQIIRGIPVSPGVVIGRIAIVGDAQGQRVPRRLIAQDANPEDEVARFEAAREASIADLKQIHETAGAEMGHEAANVFLFHIGALNDRALLEPIEQRIRQERTTAEYAAASVLRAWAAKFAKQRDAAFRTKINDLQDLATRLIKHLEGDASGAHEWRFDGPTIVAARELTPSQTAAFDREKVVGFVTDLGGPTSHTAIFARALNLPAVVGCHRVTRSASDGDTIIIDGERGTVVIDPDADTLRQYRASMEQAETYRLSLREVVDLPAVTRDGVAIDLWGNIEIADEARAVIELGGAGVGLYRTEFLYLTSDFEPTEEDHFHAYRRCIELLDGRPLTIRTVDLGADKYTQERASEPERNPFLGLRSLRYCLQNLPMFMTQLRAILRASAYGPVKVMFPLVASTQEFRQARHLLHDAMEDLEEIETPFDREIEVGMMIEVPSAAIMADSFAKEVDFFSIGTNDLVQYTLAVDRTNERVANLYQPAHPAVIRLIKGVLDVGRDRGVPVSCCGEAAADPAIAHLLIGLGLRTLSTASSSIPALKRLVRSLTIADCERTAAKALTFDSEVEAAAYVRDRARKLVPEAFDGRLDD